MVLLLSIAVVVEAFIDYQYKLVAKQSIVSKDHLTAFFGSITFYIGIFSLLFQMLFTNRILKRFGVGWAIQLLPASLLAAFIAMAIRPALWTAALVQLVDGVFSYSIHRSGMELLYLPIPPQTRNAVKGFVDTFVDRTGRAIGAVLLLLFTMVLTLSISSLSLVASVLVLTWLFLSWDVKRRYMDSFRHALEKTTIEPEAVQLRNLDGATMKTLLALLSSEDERHVLYALDLLSNTHPNRWRDHINRLIHHQSAALSERERSPFSPVGAIPRLRATTSFSMPTTKPRASLRPWPCGFIGTTIRKTAKLLNKLLRDPSSGVAREAITTAGMVGHSDALPFLIAKLADKDCRRFARAALLKFGDAVIPQLVRRLADGSLEFAVRKRIPKTLALTGKQSAAVALTQLFTGWNITWTTPFSKR
jgi:hypothetical protein